MSDAVLTDAKLHKPGPRHTDLRRAVLRGAYLLRADLTGADLRCVTPEGAFLGDAAAQTAARSFEPASLKTS